MLIRLFSDPSVVQILRDKENNSYVYKSARLNMVDKAHGGSTYT